MHVWLEESDVLQAGSRELCGGREERIARLHQIRLRIRATVTTFVPWMCVLPHESPSRYHDPVAVIKLHTNAASCLVDGDHRACQAIELWA